MPLEQYGSIIEAMKQAEEERLIKERNAAQDALAAQNTPQAIQGGGIRGKEYIDQAAQWLKDNPSPGPGLGVQFSDLARRIAARKMGEQVPDWTAYKDPLEQFRE